MSNIVPNVVISMPSQQFTLARKFQAASNGKIYIGKIDSDPTLPQNQVQVYLENEDGSTIPVAQPLIINQAGFPVYNGQIAKFVTVEGHSMAVYDSYGALQFNYPNVLKYDPDQFSIWAKNHFAYPHYEIMIGRSFTSGALIEKKNQVLMYSHDGFYYQYIGSSQLPLEVPENSVPDSNFRCVGDASYPTTVESYGADGSGVIDSSKAFQLMFDNFRGITLKYKMKYLIDKPVMISGDYLIIQGNKSELIKKTSTKSNLPLIEVYGGFVSGDVNCFFIGKERCSYVDIDGLTFDAREAPASDRPIAFYFPQITNYSIKNIDTRGCKHSLHVRSSWIGNLSNFRGNESTSHDFYYDSTRLNEDGSDAPTVQSGTSLTLDGVYSNAPKGNGFHFEKLDYSSFILTACDHPIGVPYNLSGCRGVSGTIGAESFNAEMIIAKDSTLNLTINTYVEGYAVDSYIFDFDKVIANLHGHLRLTQTKLVNAKNKTYCETNLSYWNGVTSALPASTSDSTSIVKSVSLNKSSEFEYDEVDSKYGINIVKGGTPYLGDSLPPRLGSYTSSVFKCGFSVSQNVFLIPLDYIKRVLPSFNSANSEVFTISVSQGIKYSYGTTFVVNNGVLTLDMSNQKVSNDPNIGVSAISIYQTYLSVTTKAAFNNVTITIKAV